MLAVQVAEFGINHIHVNEVLDPVAGPGEVVIAAEAATINPVDIAIVNGGLAAAFPSQARSPYTPGWDVCGRVTAVGDGVDVGLVGSRVVGFSAWMDTGRGTQSSMVALPVANVVTAPDDLAATAITTVGLNGLTAWRAVDEVAPAPGESVVVTGAAGSVGGFALQLLVARGARVIAAASERDRDALVARGASDVVAREAGDLGAAVRAIVPEGVDALLDCASLAAASLPAIRDGGRFVTVTSVPDSERGIATGRIVGVADASALAQLVRMAAAGDLSTPVAREFPIAQARAAYEEFTSGPHRGRIVLTF